MLYDFALSSRQRYTTCIFFAVYCTACQIHADGRELIATRSYDSTASAGVVHQNDGIDLEKGPSQAAKFSCGDYVISTAEKVCESGPFTGNGEDILISAFETGVTQTQRGRRQSDVSMPLVARYSGGSQEPTEQTRTQGRRRQQQQRQQQ